MIARPTAALSQIHPQIMWSRLIAVVEEQAQTLVRTAFSTSSREAGDISAGVFDLDGRMLAQAVTGTPGHINGSVIERAKTAVWSERGRPMIPLLAEGRGNAVHRVRRGGSFGTAGA